jgi:hypothetical protein
MILMFNGGHSLYATKKNSVLFEFKNGPWQLIYSPYNQPINE